MIEIEDRTIHLLPSENPIPILAGRVRKDNLQIIFSIHLARPAKTNRNGLRATVEIQLPDIGYRKVHVLEGASAERILRCGIELIHRTPTEREVQHYIDIIDRTVTQYGQEDIHNPSTR